MSAKYRLEHDVAVITMSRPDRFNAIDLATSEAMIAALSRAGEEARAVVLTGEGRAFCSGADLGDLLADYQSRGPELGRVLDRVFHPVVSALTECAVPTIAAVNGVAAGAGLGLALGCDIRVMASSAFLTSAFTAIGLVPDSGTTWLLPRYVGLSKAIELTFTNRKVSAEEALTLGLCTQVVDDGEVVAHAMEMGASFADMVPDSLVSTRKLLRQSARLSLKEGLAEERREQDRLGRTSEHLEGVHAFVEKRTPRFREQR